jgi:hypothetical protein
MGLTHSAYHPVTRRLRGGENIHAHYTTKVGRTATDEMTVGMILLKKELQTHLDAGVPSH